MQREEILHFLSMNINLLKNGASFSGFRMSILMTESVFSSKLKNTKFFPRQTTEFKSESHIRQTSEYMVVVVVECALHRCSQRYCKQSAISLPLLLLLFSLQVPILFISIPFT